MMNAIRMNRCLERRLAAVSILAILATIAFLFIKPAAPVSGPITIGLRSYTNSSALVAITNRSRSYQFNYLAVVQRKIGSDWPKGLPLGIITSAHQSGMLAPGQSTNPTLSVMTYAPPYPWRISVFCNRPPVPPNSFRFRAGLFALRLGSPKLAQKFFGGNFPQIQVSTIEMQQSPL